MADKMPAGFRFHPTDEELVVHYLERRSGTNCGVNVIAQIDLYKYDPWELPALAFVAEREWYFLTPRDRKYPNGARPNRAAGSGYWKATGTDKPIFHLQSGSVVGIKKALVFYHGKHPLAVKTNWIMHEYRLPPPSDKGPPPPSSGCLRMDDWVLCRIYKKSFGVVNKPHVPPKTEIALDNLKFDEVFDALDPLDVDT